MANNEEFEAIVLNETDNFSNESKINYDDSPISRKGEVRKFPKIYPNEYRDNNLDELIKAYKKNLQKGKHLKPEVSKTTKQTDKNDISSLSEKDWLNIIGIEKTTDNKTRTQKNIDNVNLNKENDVNLQNNKIIKENISNDKSIINLKDNKKDKTNNSKKKNYKIVKNYFKNNDASIQSLKDNKINDNLVVEKNNINKPKETKKDKIKLETVNEKSSTVNKEHKQDNKTQKLSTDNNLSKLQEKPNNNEKSTKYNSKLNEISKTNKNNDVNQIKFDKNVNNNIKSNKNNNINNLSTENIEKNQEQKIDKIKETKVQVVLDDVNMVKSNESSLSQTDNNLSSGEDICKNKNNENKSGFLNRLIKKINTDINKKDNGVYIALVIMFVVLFVFNVILSGVVIFSIKKGGDKYINNVNNQITVKGDGVTTYAVSKAKQSTVAVACGGSATDESSFYNKTVNRGTGVIYKIENNSAYIITCQHVISGYESTVYVLFSTYLKPIKVSVVGYSVDYDVAVLKVKDISNIEGISAISLYNSEYLVIGETVFTVGNSLSGGLSASSGIISYLNKKISLENGINREIQTDVSINPGNSGGGLFNNAGQFIGLVSAKFSSTTTEDGNINVEGISFSVPSLLVKNIAESIIKNKGSATYIDIGVEFKHSDRYVTTTHIDGKDIEKFEVKVSSVASGSSAKGILKVDDTILSFKYTDLNGKIQEIEMINEYCFEDIMFDILEGSEIEFNIYRSIGNEKKTLIVQASSVKVKK